MWNRSGSIVSGALEACRLGLFALTLSLALAFGSTAPARGERLWLDHYRIGSEDIGNIPQPSPVLPGCLFPGCFPGFSQQPLRLETSVHGPFLKRWILGLQELPAVERGGVTVAGSAEKLGPAGNAIKLGSAGIVGNLRAERAGSLPILPLTVELDLDAVRSWFSDEARLHAEPPQLVLEARYLIGTVEVHRSRVVYDFTDPVAPAAVSAGDKITLQNYDTSPVVLLAQGSNLAQRQTDLYFNQAVVNVDDMTSATPNMEVAVWSSGNQPALLRQPALNPGFDDIMIPAPGLLKPTPNLRLPAGNVAPGITWEELAKCDYAVANHLFRSNRLGIELQLATTGTSNGTVCEAEATLRENTNFFTQGNLNISYVDQIYPPQNCCMQNVPEAMFITQLSTPTTLAHELAHSFGLRDNEGDTGNIMRGGALDRRDFTLPQVYLMMFGAESTLNSLGLRASSSHNTRNGTDCPTRCKSGAMLAPKPECVDLRATFSRTGSPSATDEIQDLLMALSSEESIPGEAPFDLNDPLARHPDLLPFLKGVAILGPRRDKVAAIVRAIRSHLNNQECPIAADAYVDFYSDRIKKISQRAAANALFSLDTAEAKEALKAVRQAVSGALREHIDNLLLNW